MDYRFKSGNGHTKTGILAPILLVNLVSQFITTQEMRYSMLVQIGTARNVTQNVVTIENPGASTAVSTRFLEKGDFVRLQNATIGYNGL